MEFRRNARLARSLAVVVAAAVCLAGSHTVAPAQSVDQNLWVTNGNVFSVVRDGGTTYIGGDFTRVGPATGSGVPLDAATGELPASFPKVVGWVYAVAADGAGGWYVGGSFTSVGGLPRSNLAHLAADLSLSAWGPDANGHVAALAVSGSTVYAAGQFTSIGGQARNHIAALDAATGAATEWNPNASGGSCRHRSADGAAGAPTPGALRATGSFAKLVPRDADQAEQQEQHARRWRLLRAMTAKSLASGRSFTSLRKILVSEVADRAQEPETPPDRPGVRQLGRRFRWTASGGAAPCHVRRMT